MRSPLQTSSSSWSAGTVCPWANARSMSSVRGREPPTSTGAPSSSSTSSGPRIRSSTASTVGHGCQRLASLPTGLPTRLDGVPDDDPLSAHELAVLAWEAYTRNQVADAARLASRASGAAASVPASRSTGSRGGVPRDRRRVGARVRPRIRPSRRVPARRPRQAGQGSVGMTHNEQFHEGGR